MSTKPIDYRALAKAHNALSSVHESEQPEVPPAVQRIESAVGMQLKAASPHQNAIATVAEHEPHVVEINDPQRFGKDPKQVEAHEATHLLLNQLAGPVQNAIPPDDPKRPYDISNIDELRKSGKRLWNLPQEQAATIVQMYTADPSQRARLQPWIDDLNQAPLSVEKPTSPGDKGIVSAIRPPTPPIEAWQAPQVAKPHQMSPAPDPRLNAVQKQFPRLAPYLSNVTVQQGKKTNPKDDRGLEFYPPWESQNPNPGKITLELFDKMQGPTLTNALGGDLLHYVGSVDPKTNKPIDPQYYAMKQAVLKARTPQQQAMDTREYANAVKNEGEKRSLAQWLQQSRIDAYIRGYVTPELGGRYPDEWRKQGQYRDPAMLKAVEAIKQYVTTGPTLQETKAKAAQLKAGGVK